jgi:branched-chain amino acid aminotransferase/4-amino-4-deoxychorismate lyase
VSAPPSVPADDRGLLLGDGLFETLRARGGELEDFEAHLARMTRGCAVLGIVPPDPEAARRLAAEALAGEGLSQGDAVVRLTLTAGSGRGLDRPEAGPGRLICSASPLAAPPGPARLALSPIRRNDTSPASRLKALSYLDNVLARRAARAAGADEAVLLNTRGEVACAAAANLFWIAEGRLFTPALECGVLDGIMRARVLVAAAALGVEAAEVRAGPVALAGAEAVFLTNSLTGVRQVAALEARAFQPHPLAEALSSRCR